MSIDITPKMAHTLILCLIEHNVEYVVAPYEADAQLAYLFKSGQADVVFTEDSDLLAFGCTHVFFKMAIAAIVHFEKDMCATKC